MPLKSGLDYDLANFGSATYNVDVQTGYLDYIHAAMAVAAPPSNFAFLQVHDEQLVRLGLLAEQYFADDPNTCLIKLRQYGEVLAQYSPCSSWPGRWASGTTLPLPTNELIGDYSMLLGPPRRLAGGW